MTTTVTCPDCHGRGTIEGLANVQGKGCEWRTMTCFRCKGEKVISETMITWMQRGEAMSEDRKSRGLSLREEAKRLGIHVVELSHMEHGKKQPFDYDLIKKDV